MLTIVWAFRESWSQITITNIIIIKSLQCENYQNVTQTWSEQVWLEKWCLQTCSMKGCHKPLICKRKIQKAKPTRCVCSCGSPVGPALYFLKPWTLSSSLPYVGSQKAIVKLLFFLKPCLIGKWFKLVLYSSHFFWSVSTDSQSPHRSACRTLCTRTRPL